MKTPGFIIKSIKPLVSILLLCLVFYSVDISKISRDLKSFNSKWPILLLAATWAGQLICSERRRIIAASLDMKGSYWSFVRMYFIGMFFNIGLPSLVGGDIVKSYLFGNAFGKPMHLGLAAVISR